MRRYASIYRLLGSLAQRRHKEGYPDKEITMYVSNESLLAIVLVGLVAGWLAGKIVYVTGLGLINDMIIGVVGAFAGDWLMPQLGIHLRPGIIGAIINATIGAILLLLIIRLVRGRSPCRGVWGGGWSRRWGSRRHFRR